MKHVVFVDTSIIGLRALRAAKKAGHYVSFIGSRRLEKLVGSFEVLRDQTLTDQVVVIETSQDEVALLQATREIATGRAVDAMFTVVEACVEPVAKCARTLDITCTDPEAVTLSQDKALCRQRVADHGLASIKHAVVDNLADALRAAEYIRYPLMAKPNRGALSLRALKIEDESQLRDYFSSLDDGLDAPDGFLDALSQNTILEHYVDGPLFSVEIAVAGGEVHPLALSWRKRCAVNPAIELGTVIPAPVSTSIRNEMLEYATAVVNACGLDLGIFHVELIYGSDGPMLVEVNPRIMGGNIPAVFVLATDTDPFALLVEIFLTGHLSPACYDVSPVRAAVTRNLGPKREGLLPESLPDDWDVPFRDLLSAYSYKYSAGGLVPEMNNTFYPFHFQLVRPSSIEASLIAEWIVTTAADETRLDLRRSSEDYLLLKR
ncbi:ATP-grasp domain-containing protein [uncultured Tateyamaria sp.]|uniref:ATP-grasp domain-containing protein n=1 Tax=uncultured Tateyamaria sp. TaxID=455651 RepID=UPI00261C4F3F|nr:ATP-grasp domain-containing protein [uncultured Tateyamaria sp.]